MLTWAVDHYKGVFRALPWFTLMSNSERTSAMTRKCRTLHGRAWASWYRNIMSLGVNVTSSWVQVDLMDPSLSSSTLMDLLNATEYSSPCMFRLSSLASLTSVSDCLRSCSLWCQHCSLAVALSSHSRRNLSLRFSRFNGVELDGESSVTFSTFIVSTCTEHE